MILPRMAPRGKGSLQDCHSLTSCIQCLLSEMRSWRDPMLSNGERRLIDRFSAENDSIMWPNLRWQISSSSIWIDPRVKRPQAGLIGISIPSRSLTEGWRRRGQPASHAWHCTSVGLLLGWSTPFLIFLDIVQVFHWRCHFTPMWVHIAFCFID